MRPSNRNKILDAAVRVIHRDGLIGVTFDSVAAEAGVTRGGMMYHFPARNALIQAIHEHLAAQWEAGLQQVAGKPKSSATPQERAIAYARISARSANRAELLSFSNRGNPCERGGMGRGSRWVGIPCTPKRARSRRFSPVHRAPRG